MESIPRGETKKEVTSSGIAERRTGGRLSAGSQPVQPRISALAELERQQAAPHFRSHRQYLSWADRQRLVDSSLSGLWPVLVALGMLCMVSISLTGLDNAADIRNSFMEGIEEPFVPHEAETLLQQHRGVDVQSSDADSDRESGPLLLSKKREFMSQDEGGKLVDWVERHISISDSLFTPRDYDVLMEEAPEDLLPLQLDVAKLANKLKTKSRKVSSLKILLQLDLIAAAQFMLLCRVVAAKSDLREEYMERLTGMLKLLVNRFSKEWKEALNMTHYVADVHERLRYQRLVSHIATITEETALHIMAENKPENKGCHVQMIASRTLGESRDAIE
ncbi:hypothetical protein cyc_05543 [Cyclospora cayetanensis]|uniref:Transmembrane protein n=1 Tax=Cyclospora cayetanensis TaxID=88456 RepID=A0A1D3D8A8_9EIME|nr:hypothetical protein cyc_05543 [Cyclospora cayetanensis]